VLSGLTYTWWKYDDFHFPENGFSMFVKPEAVRQLRNKTNWNFRASFCFVILCLHVRFHLNSSMRGKLQTFTFVVLPSVSRRLFLNGLLDIHAVWCLRSSTKNYTVKCYLIWGKYIPFTFIKNISNTKNGKTNNIVKLSTAIGF